jgi:hypothetical protein
MAINFHPIQAVKNGIAAVGRTVKAVVVWIGQIFTEPDGNGGKASFSRIVGAYITYEIVDLVRQAPPEHRLDAVPPVLLTLWMFLVGYQLLSKILNNLTPAVLDFFRAMLVKAGASVQLPGPQAPPAQ